MRIKVESQTAQRVLLISLVAGFALSAVWIVKTYFADRAGHTLTISSLRLASRLNPGNSMYHVRLGRLYQYSITNPRPKQAIQQFEDAIKANPFSPRGWVNLAAAHEFQGDTAKAEEALRHASALAPNLPRYQWTIGNYFLLHGNTQEAFRHLKVVLAGSRQYDHAVFNIAWKATNNPTQILKELIPNDLPAELSRPRPVPLSIGSPLVGRYGNGSCRRGRRDSWGVLREAGALLSRCLPARTRLGAFPA